MAGAILVVVGIVAGGTMWWLRARHYESTDDAFISARQYAVSSKVGGFVTAVPVDDNQHVEAGAPLIRIDERDYQTALARSKAQVAQAKASVNNVAAQIDEQAAQIDQAAAQVKLATAALTFSQQEYDRFKTLAKHGNATVERAQQVASDLAQKQASSNAATATLEVARKQLGVLQAQKASAEASAAKAEAGEKQAELDLSYTTITAAESGRVVQLSAAKGQLAQVGQALMMFVPDKLWVIANFKETQLADMRPGQPVTIEIDAYPKLAFKGHVDSIQPGSGTAFSLLPAENATGNYVKVTQRVPVKILLDDVPKDVVLGPGMSVVPEVKVR